MAAEDKASERKVLVDVGAIGQAIDAIQPILNLLVGFKADEWLVLPPMQRNIPLGSFQIASVERLREQTCDAHVRDNAARVFREEGVFLKETHDIGLCAEAPLCIPFKRFADDGGGGLVLGKHFSAPRNALVLIACRSLKHPVTVHHARPHTVDGLLAVLLPLVLGNTGEEVFDQDRIRIIAELNSWRFQSAARLANLGPQFEVSLKAACQP